MRDARLWKSLKNEVNLGWHRTQEAMDWLNEMDHPTKWNCKFRMGVNVKDDGPPGWNFRFEDEQLAVLFKLRWVG